MLLPAHRRNCGEQPSLPLLQTPQHALPYFIVHLLRGTMLVRPGGKQLVLRPAVNSVTHAMVFVTAQNAAASPVDAQKLHEPGVVPDVVVHVVVHQHAPRVRLERFRELSLEGFNRGKKSGVAVFFRLA